MAKKKKVVAKKSTPSKRGLSKKKSGSERRSRHDDQDTQEQVLPGVVPVLPVRDLVPFPSVMMSLQVGRTASIRALEVAMQSEKTILIISQNNLEVEEPKPDHLNTVGVVANVVRTLKLPDGRLKVLAQGLTRARAVSFSAKGTYIEAKIEPLASDPDLKLSAEDRKIVNRVRANLEVLVEHEHVPEEMLLVLEEVEDPGLLSDLILAHYRLDIPFAQSLLEELDPLKRLRAVDSIITDDLNQFLVSETIRGKARDELEKDQREYYLREQIKQIQMELGESESTSEDLASLKAALAEAKIDAPAKVEAERQFSRLERMHPESSEYALLRTYLEWLADLPWSIRTKERLDLKAAEKILNEDHFGLDKAKERIIEYLSVRKLKTNPKGPILCFVGPPGVGKTSLGQSIARALNRKFFRISLGGVRDEAEIRGHRRTYVGALPGKVIQGLKQVGSKNCVFVLDELDKVGADFRGDPASALLEVLDPAQNKTFRDHYLNVDFDLSEILFVATANTLDTIPEALIDRLEVISISGYTTEEKLAIARQHLIPRQLDENGLAPKSLHFEDAAILLLIERYTREAGVRNLERELGSLCRKIARQFSEKKTLPKKVDANMVRRLLGATKYDPELSEKRNMVGLVRGLAWTIHGGEVMPVEASTAKGTGELILTGQLGDVMRESAQAAVFYARAHSRELGLDPDFYGKRDIHIHVPGGATPKDGPSAGITIAVALVSALTERPVSSDIAMTGEITLRGSVMAVGGIKEKALAALHHGIKKVIIPYENVKDLEEVPKEQRDRITFIPVKHVSEVFEIALLKRDQVIKKADKILRRPKRIISAGA